MDEALIGAERSEGLVEAALVWAAAADSRLRGSAPNRQQVRRKPDGHLEGAAQIVRDLGRGRASTL